MNQASSSSDWRQGLGASSDTRESWRRPQKLPEAAPRRWGRWLRFTLSVLGLICTLFLIWFLFDFLGRTHVGIVAISLSQSSSDVSQIPFGEIDARKIRSLSSKSMIQPVVSPGIRQEGGKGFGASLKELNRSDVLILYINGECILKSVDFTKPSIEILTQDESLSLSALLDLLKKQTSTRQKKLLLLDICRSRADWERGVLPAVIDTIVATELEKAQIPNLVVMLADTISTSSGMSSALPDARSAFANFILQGLAGEESDQNRDQRVSVLELFQFVRTNVVNWSSDCRHADRPQFPVMIPPPADLPSALNFSLSKMVLKDDARVPSINKQELEVLYKDSQSIFDNDSKAPRRRVSLESNRFQGLARQVESNYIAQQSESFRTGLTELRKLIVDIQKTTTTPPTDHLPPTGTDVRNYIDREFAAEMQSQYLSQKPLDQGAPGERPLSQETLLTSIEISQKYLRESSASEDNIRKAIEIRKQADALFTEPLGVLTWIELDLAELGNAVRESENLVLSEATDQEIKNQIETADRQLTVIRNVVDDVKEAQRTLDRAFVVLPQLVRWVGTCSTTRSPLTPEKRSRLAASLLAWRNAKGKETSWILGEGQFLKGKQPVVWNDDMLPDEYRALSGDAIERIEPQLIPLLVFARRARQQIRDLPGDPKELRSSLDSFKQITQSLELGLSRIEDLLEIYAKGHADKPTPTPQASDFRTVSNLQALDWIQPKHRQKLLSFYDSYDKTLNERSKTATERKSVVTEAADLQQVAGDCLWQTFWMIQSYSLVQIEGNVSDEVSRWSDAATDRYSPALQIPHAHKIAIDLADNWTTAKKQIETAFRDNNKDKYTDYYAILRRADLAARALPPRMAKELLMSFPGGNTPTIQLEQTELLKRLILLAKRSAEDFWASSTTEQKEDWYRLSSQTFEQAAREMSSKFPNATWASHDVKANQERLKELASSKVIPVLEKGGNEVSFGFATQVKKPINIQTQGSPPVGTAAMQIKQREQKVEVEPKVIIDVVPKVRRVRVDPKPESVQHVDLLFQLPRNSAKDQPQLSMDVGITYRGHRWTCADPLVAIIPEHKGMKLVWSSSTDTAGSICLRGSSRRKVLFVLDCSESMNDPIVVEDAGSDKTLLKFDVAKKTLRDVFNRPDLNGDRIGLETFGRTQKPGIIVDDIQYDIPIAIMDNSHRDGLKQALDRIATPVGKYTRCLTAISSGLQKLNSTVDREPGLLVVITDGATSDGDLMFKDIIKKTSDPAGKSKMTSDPAGLTENYIAENMTKRLLKNPESQWPNLQSIYRNCAHKVIVIKYAIPEGGEDDDIFSMKRMKDFETKALDPNFLDKRPFRIENAPTGEKLLEVILESLKPREYSVVGVGGEPITCDLGKAAENLSPGDYRVVFDHHTYNVSLQPGQKLEIDTEWENGQYLFRRKKETSHGDKRVAAALNAVALNSDNPADGSPTLAAIKQIELTLSGEVKLIAILEHPYDDLAVTPPQEVLFSVMAGGNPVESDITITPAVDYQSPAYNIQISQWPPQKSASLQVAWKMKKTMPTEVMSYSELNPKLKTEKVLGKRTWNLQAYPQRQDSSVVLEMEPVPTTQAPEENADFHLTPSMIRVELGTKLPNGFVADAAQARTVEVFKSGRIKAYFTLSAGISDADLAEKSIAITIPEDLLQGATRTDVIEAKTFDQTSLE